MGHFRQPHWVDSYPQWLKLGLWCAQVVASTFRNLVFLDKSSERTPIHFGRCGSTGDIAVMRTEQVVNIRPLELFDCLCLAMLETVGRPFL